jgi:DNA-directed RNA polymerase specialized sigma24 family protein
MAPRRAIEYIKAFELPAEEEICIIEADVRKRSLVEIALARNMAVDTVKRNRKRAYMKIADQINN